MKKYKNYIFGLYGTLANIHTEETTRDFWQQIARFMGYQGAVYEGEELRKAYQEHCAQLMAAREAELAGSDIPSYPELPLEKVFAALYEEKGVKAGKDLIVYTGQAFRTASTTLLKNYDGAVELLTDLRKAGAKVYLLTNSQRILTLYELRYLGLEDCFDDVMFSSDFGCRKPDIRVFDAVMKKHKMKPEETVMIGNGPENDIGGAKNAGMDALFLRSGFSSHLPDSIKAAEEAGADYILYKMDLNRLRQLLLSAFQE